MTSLVQFGGTVINVVNVAAVEHHTTTTAVHLVGGGKLVFGKETGEALWNYFTATSGAHVVIPLEDSTPDEKTRVIGG